MFQKIASICSIGSFLVGIYIIFADYPKWQWRLLFGIGLLFIIIALIAKKHKPTQPHELITFNRAEFLPYSSDGNVEMEIFYPKPFKSKPHLKILPPTRAMLRSPGRAGVGAIASQHTLEYKIMEHRPDGFKIKFLAFPSNYKPMFKWQAEGEMGGREDKERMRYLYNSKQSEKRQKKEEGYIGGKGPTD